MTATANLHLTYGAAFIGLVCSAILYGITILQTYLYFRMYTKDDWWTKGSVGLIFILDSAHISLCTYSIYWYLVIEYGDTTVLNNILWSISIQTVFNGTIADMVQMYFSYRVYRLSRSWLLTAVVVAFALGHFSIVIQFPVRSFQLKYFSNFNSERTYVCAGFACSAVADGVIAAAMCYHLAKQRTQYSRTNSVITTLIIYSVNTGLLTSMISTSCLIAFAVAPDNFIWLAFFWVLGKCYSNSLLGLLNSRSHVRECYALKNSEFLELSHIPESPHETSPRVQANMFGKPNDPTPLAISVQTTTKRDVELDQDFKVPRDTTPEP